MDVAGGSFGFGFSYDALSRRTQMTRPNSVITDCAYDNLSRLLSVLHKLSSSTIDGASYTVDAVGNRTAKANQLPSGPTENYTYDAIYQLTQVAQAGPTTTESYSYDGVGNRTASLGVSPWSYNSSNHLTQIAGSPATTFAYDNNGNTTSKTDAAGTTSYSWDYENRLVSVTLPNSGGTVSFTYDPLGRRIRKVFGGATTIYAYDGENIVEETDASGNAVARYTMGLSIDEPLATLRSSATHYYSADGLGSVTSLTDGSGAVAASYTYDTFGNLAASTGSVVNPFRYTAREWDSESGLYYYRARYYSPSFGRFVSEDPLRFGNTNNLYPYVRNNPVLLKDPTGRSPGDVAAIVAKAGELVALMNAAGLRYPGPGGGPLNNLLSTVQTVINGIQQNQPRLFPIEYLGCGSQADFVVNGLIGLQANSTKDDWTFVKEEGWFLDSLLYHQRYRGVSSNKSDPDIIIDPWNDRYQLVPKGQNATDHGWVPLAGRGPK